ncbi:hypothetical protein [Actinorhabdospora filicis]|uniref:hypothetical protein n=1 Tax=Actinorhabdospora filicis TaxID=1785913 RepID=UPI0025537B93|nr:hypothetical protein [Actinorhabdospora filicis]
MEVELTRRSRAQTAVADMSSRRRPRPSVSTRMSGPEPRGGGVIADGEWDGANARSAPGLDAGRVDGVFGGHVEVRNVARREQPE